MSQLSTALIIVNLTYLLVAIFYAWQIYLAPSPHGWTWISVAVGTGLVVYATMFNYFILFHFDGLTLENILTAPAGTLIIAGLPMVAGQAVKKYREDRDNSKLIDGDNG